MAVVPKKLRLKAGETWFIANFNADTFYAFLEEESSLEELIATGSLFKRTEDGEETEVDEETLALCFPEKSVEEILSEIIERNPQPRIVDENMPTLVHRRDLEANLLTDDQQISDALNPNEWHNLHGEEFDVRVKDAFDLKAQGLRYKYPSAKSIYEGVLLTKFQSNPQNLDPRSVFDIPVDPNFPEKCRLPQYVIVNVAVPTYAPGYLQQVTEGESTNIVHLLRLSQETIERYEKGEETEAEMLLERFLYRPEPPEGDYNVRRRLKVTARICNVNSSEISFPYVVQGLIARYNGVPRVFRDSTSFIIEDGYVVVNVDANLFGRIAKNGLWSMKDYVKPVVVDCCMVIEGDGELNEELPEIVFGAFRVAKLDVFPE